MERFRLPIPHDAVPIAHQPPYRRIDLAAPQGYPKVITAAEVASDGGREPDPRKYKFRFVFDVGDGDTSYWELKKEFC